MSQTPVNKENQKLLNRLVKSVSALVAVVVLLVGLVLVLTFLPEITADFGSDSTQTAAEIIYQPTDPIEQIVAGKDVATGLIAGEGLELVKGNCTNCHSSALILQNRFTREGWHEKIVWMQETQGLWDLGTSEDAILDYLATHYAPEAPKGRRIPLSGIEWYELEE